MRGRRDVILTANRVCGARGPAARWPRAWAMAGLAAGLFTSAIHADEPTTPPPGSPYFDQPEALAEAERIYRGRCIGCHFRSGGRGPNLFRTKLSEAQFIEIVAKGARNGMPAWGSTLTGAEMQKLYALVISRDRL